MTSDTITLTKNVIINVNDVNLELRNAIAGNYFIVDFRVYNTINCGIYDLQIRSNYINNSNQGQRLFSLKEYQTAVLNAYYGDDPPTGGHLDPHKDAKEFIARITYTGDKWVIRYSAELNYVLDRLSVLNDQQSSDTEDLQSQIDTINDEISAIQAVDSTQNGRLDAIEEYNPTQAGQISSLQSSDSTQNSRLSSIESVNTTQTNQINTLNTEVNDILGPWLTD